MYMKSTAHIGAHQILGVAHGILMMRRIKKTHNSCEGTLRMTAWDQSNWWEAASIWEIFLCTMQRPKQQLQYFRETLWAPRNSSLIKLYTCIWNSSSIKTFHEMSYLHGWNENSHQLQIPAFSCVFSNLLMFSYSFISAQWKVNVFCLHSFQILVSRIFCWVCKSTVR